jgi:sugar lactone lactonase YvrE
MPARLPIAAVATLAAVAALAAQAACAARTPAASAGASVDPGRPVAVVDSFTQPEAVRYDADQDVYFVSNFGPGGSNALDDNGFISRMRPDGGIERLRFVAGGTGGATLHAPRGMTITGDTLWVCDEDAVRGFHRRSGAPVATYSFAGIDHGFLNDVAASPDGTLYVTDTGRNRIYRLSGRDVAVAVADTALGSPNGITWDAPNGRFLVVPFGGAHAIRAWQPGGALRDVGTSGGARFDGVEVLSGGRVLVASQADTSLHLFAGGTGRPVIRTSGHPADIAVDTRRGRVAVPFISLNRVEIWQLPRE